MPLLRLCLRATASAHASSWSMWPLYHCIDTLLPMREICGTTKGYRRHKYLKEEKCQPCKDAYNVFRRSIYSPENNKKHRTTYFSKPEKKEQNRQYHKKFNLSPEERERRKQERRAATEEKERLKKAAKKENYQAYLAELAERKIKRLEKERLERQERARLRQERRDQERLGAEIAKIIEKQLKDGAREEARRVREAEKEALRAEKARQMAEQRERLLNQHGTSIGDYDRCRQVNGTACDLCKAAAADYQREYAKKNPEKVAAWNKLSNNRRYRNPNGQEFYTEGQVLQRWGRDCHICKEPIDLDAPSQCGRPGWERGLHLDHVIPLSRGGSDTLDNVKPSHAKCNIDKGARLLPELLA